MHCLFLFNQRSFQCLVEIEVVEDGQWVSSESGFTLRASQECLCWKSQQESITYSHLEAFSNPPTGMFSAGGKHTHRHEEE